MLLKELNLPSSGAKEMCSYFGSRSKTEMKDNENEKYEETANKKAGRNS